MSETVTAANGAALPISSLTLTLAYDGTFVSSITTGAYAGIVYRKTFTNDGTNITNISQWQVVP